MLVAVVQYTNKVNKNCYIIWLVVSLIYWVIFCLLWITTAAAGSGSVHGWYSLSGACLLVLVQHTDAALSIITSPAQCKH